jgi:uncharacterized membrane protein
MLAATHLALVIATFLCSLVAGFLFAFAVVVMPGLSHLDDRAFLRAFQRVDGVIQRGQPLFGLVWLGSVVALAAGLALSMAQLNGLERVLLAVAAGAYLLGVQLPTVVVNVPLNNELQALDVECGDQATCHAARERFEARWTRWNMIRTALAAVTSAVLIALLGRI